MISPTAAGSLSAGSFAVFSGAFIDEKDDAIGDMWLGDTTMVDVQTFLEALLTMHLSIILANDQLNAQILVL